MPWFRKLARCGGAADHVLLYSFSMRGHPALVAVVAISLLAGCGAASKKPPQSALPVLKDPVQLAARGDAYAEAGDFTRAEQYFGAAIAAGGKSAEILPRLLRACVGAGDLRLAAEYAETELSRRPDNSHLRFVTGALYAQLGNQDVAREHLVQAASELPNDAEVQFCVAAFFRDDVKDRVVADPYFREYLRLDPKGTHAEEARHSILVHVQ